MKNLTNKRNAVFLSILITVELTKKQVKRKAHRQNLRILNIFIIKMLFEFVS